MKELPIIPIDDAFIGVCLRKLGLRPTNHKGFKSWGIKYLEQNNCVWNEVMTFHKLQPEELEQMWKAFVKRGKKLGSHDSNGSAVRYRFNVWLKSVCYEWNPNYTV